MNSKHTTIIESWDHPVKAPFYYIPNQCIHWNSDLKQLAIEYQNFRNITHKNMFPLKFNYIDTLRSSDLPSLKKAMSKSELEEIEKLTKVKYIVYVCTTSSKNIEHPYRHNEECAFIEDLGITAREFGYLLYVKPKPNGVKGDYDHVMKNNSNIIVGVYSVNTDGTDTTRHGYHAFRKALVYNAEFVVNVASTFALEAALMGTRVAQVNLLGNNRYPHFSHYSRNLHVKKFLNNLAAFSITNKDMENLFLPEARDKMDSFVLNIKRWLGA